MQALKFMRNRIETFAALPLSSLDRMTTQVKLRAIGNLPGSTSPRVA